MKVQEPAEYLPVIANVIRSGRAVLFLGAGSSCAAGGPTSAQLEESIRQRFTGLEDSISGLMEICQDVIDTPPYSRSELITYIFDRIGKLEPRRDQKELVRYDWASIFTTNFDDLIEITYRTERSNRPLVAVDDDDPVVNIANGASLFLFKLMGTIRPVAEKSTAVLTRADYNRAIIRRQKYFRILSDFAKDGSLLFIGYSFRDGIMLELLDDIISVAGRDVLPWSYAVLPDFEPTPKNVNVLMSRKVIPIKMTMRKFLRSLESVWEAPSDISTPKHTLLIGSKSVEVADSMIRHLSEYYEVVTQERIANTDVKIDDFFRGSVRAFGPYRNGFDFIRSFYEDRTDVLTYIDGKPIGDALKNLLKAALELHSPGENRIMGLLGMPGIGKTVLLRRIAFDIASSGLGPVIFVKPDRVALDYKLLATFLDNVADELRGSKVTLEPKALVIIDNASMALRHIVRMKNYLTARNRPVLILAAARVGEWQYEIDSQSIRMGPKQQILLPEYLDDEEIHPIVEHFHSIGIINIRDEWFARNVAKETQSSFFATIYRLVDPARRTLDEIIRDQYLSLQENAQIAFRNVCLFDMHGLAINLELLVRSVGITYEDFYSTLEGELSHVLFEDQDVDGNILIRTHHRVIAQRTAELFFSDPREQCEAYVEILSSAVFENRKERELCEFLLVSILGPNSRLRRNPFTPDQQRAMFRAICDRYEGGAILHHYAILESSDHEYSKAEELLQKALGIPRDATESFAGESAQNILTTLGTVYSRWALEEIEKDSTDAADAHFEKAEQTFEEAKLGEFINVHAYHAIGHMNLRRAQHTASAEERVKLLAFALETTRCGQDNTDDEERLILDELESQIWLELGDIDVAYEIAERIATTHDSARGYYVRASWYANKASRSPDSTGSSEISSAFETLKEALCRFPSDEGCLALQCRLLREHMSDNHVERYRYLKAWHAVSRGDSADLLFDLARLAFILGYYEAAKGYFRQLEEGVGARNRKRLRAQAPIISENGRPKRFAGTVRRMQSATIGEVECHDLRDLRYGIRFHPRATGFNVRQSDPVTFEILFDFVGPVATRLRKI